MWTHPTIGSPLVLLLGGAAVVLTTTVVSQPRAAGESISPRRLRELEARVADLELRVRAMEQQQGVGVASSSVRSFPSLEAHDVSCDPAYMYDSDGNRVLLTGCEARARGACDPRFVVDANGSKRVRPGCHAEASDRAPGSTVDRLGF